jgi:predicted N-acetyltransferase YhbS
MAMDLDSLQTGHSRPAGLQVVADNKASVEHVKNLPYGGDNGAVSRALMKALPGSVQQFIAILKNKIVGHCCLFLNEGEYGVAGLYNVAVLPAVRQQGIGKALVTAACQLARERGWRYAVLNATGRRMYEQVGFRWIGDGHTWWVVRSEVFGREAPGMREVALAEAVGLGDIEAMERIGKGEPENAPIVVHGLLGEDELDRPLANGLTLLQLAIYCRQTAAAEWLVGHGAGYTVLEAWDLGWKERAAALLAAEPSLVNFQYGQGLTTLLHIAADRNDMDLARFALSAGPDLGIKDKFYKSTALGWAKYFQRGEIIRLIEGESR